MARRKRRPRPPAEDLPTWLLESLRSPSSEHPVLSVPMRERLAELAAQARAAGRDDVVAEVERALSSRP
jgi:hypothetical protein